MCIDRLQSKQDLVNEVLQKLGFDLDLIDACYWSEFQCDKFLSNLPAGITDSLSYLKSLDVKICMDVLLSRIIVCPYCGLEFFGRDIELLNGVAKCPDCGRVIRFKAGSLLPKGE